MATSMAAGSSSSSLLTLDQLEEEKDSLVKVKKEIQKMADGIFSQLNSTLIASMAVSGGGGILVFQSGSTSCGIILTLFLWACVIFMTVAYVSASALTHERLFDLEVLLEEYNIKKSRLMRLEPAPLPSSTTTTTTPYQRSHPATMQSPVAGEYELDEITENTPLLRKKPHQPASPQTPPKSAVPDTPLKTPPLGSPLTDVSDTLRPARCVQPHTVDSHEPKTTENQSTPAETDLKTPADDSPPPTKLHAPIDDPGQPPIISPKATPVENQSVVPSSQPAVNSYTPKQHSSPSQLNSPSQSLPPPIPSPSPSPGIDSPTSPSLPLAPDPKSTTKHALNHADQNDSFEILPAKSLSSADLKTNLPLAQDPTPKHPINLAENGSFEIQSTKPVSSAELKTFRRAAETTLRIKSRMWYRGFFWGIVAVGFIQVASPLLTHYLLCSNRKIEPKPDHTSFVPNLHLMMVSSELKRVMVATTWLLCLKLLGRL